MVAYNESLCQLIADATVWRLSSNWPAGERETFRRLARSLQQVASFVWVRTLTPLAGTLSNAIEAPVAPGVKLHHLTTVWLDGKPGSEIAHIINPPGGRVYAHKPAEAMGQTLNQFGGTEN